MENQNTDSQVDKQYFFQVWEMKDYIHDLKFYYVFENHWYSSRRENEVKTKNKNMHSICSLEGRKK